MTYFDVMTNILTSWCIFDAMKSLTSWRTSWRLWRIFDVMTKLRRHDVCCCCNVCIVCLYCSCYIIYINILILLAKCAVLSQWLFHQLSLCVCHLGVSLAAQLCFLSDALVLSWNEVASLSRYSQRDFELHVVVIKFVYTVMHIDISNYIPLCISTSAIIYRYAYRHQ